MNDPMSVLEAHRPYVRETLPAERLAARSVLEAAMQAEADGATPPVVTPLPSGKRRHLRRRVAVAVGGIAAATTGVATLLWPSATPGAMAGWDPAPRTVSAADTARIDELCRVLGQDPELGGVVPAEATLVQVDVRGTTALASYETPTPATDTDGIHLDAGTMYSACFVDGHGPDWLDQPDVSGGGGGLVEDGTLDNPEIPGPLRDVTTSGVGGIGVAVDGFVEPSVAEVVVILDGGERLDAVMTDGYFSVFWPATEPDVATVEMHDASGKVISTYDYEIGGPIENP